MKHHPELRLVPRPLCRNGREDDCCACPLAAAAVCRLLNGSTRSTRRVFARGSHIISAGTKANITGVLKSGFLRIEHVSRHGRRSVLTLHQPGDLIGNWTGGNETYLIEAATRVELCLHDGNAVTQLLAKDANARWYLITELSELAERQRTMLWHLGVLDSRQRIMSFLIDHLSFMPPRCQIDGSALIRMEVSRQDWADLTCTTVETVCRTLTDLKNHGFIEPINPQLFKIKNIDALKKFLAI
ncbi:Crp/Fnr family transcriptional regulator [Paracoccus nototheniae]